MYLLLSIYLFIHPGTKNVIQTDVTFDDIEDDGVTDEHFCMFCRWVKTEELGGSLQTNADTFK